MDAASIVRALELEPHPEGGFFRETFRADLAVEAPQGRRAASTAIYYLLPAGDVSRFHRVRADEVWHHYAGGPLELHTIDAEGRHRMTLLGPEVLAGQAPQAVVPAGVLQAARPRGAFALCGCTVAPGFDFADFALVGREALLEAHPDHRALIEALAR